MYKRRKAEETRNKSTFPKKFFSDKHTLQTSTTDHKKNTDNSETRSSQTENETTSTATQTKSSGEQQKSDDEIWVSRVDPTRTIQEERRHNEAPPTMTKNTLPEASYELVTEGLVATLVKATNTTEAEEDTPLFRKKLQRVLGVRFNAAATKKDRNFCPLINFVKTRDWEAIKASYVQYWHNIRNKQHVREDCLLTDERIILPTQLRQTILDSIHLTHPGSRAMLHLCQHVWFPHIHRTIVHWAQNCKHCTEQGRNLKLIIGTKHSFLMEPVVEPNEEVQLDFAGPLPDELNRDAYILVAMDKWSQFPTAKVVANTTADIAIKFMQRYISKNGVPRRLRCDQAQTLRAKKFQFFFATVIT